MAKEWKARKKANARTKIPIYRTIHSWKCGFYAGVDAFLDAHKLNKMIAANIAAESMDFGQTKNQTDN